jgi:hypothetical protein
MKRVLAYAGLLALVLSPLVFADTKISALPAGTTLAGTEPIPTVQSAATVATTPAAINTYTQAQLTSTVVKGKWSGTCDATTFLRGDGACSLVSPSNFTGVLSSSNGGTQLSAALDDNTIVGNGTTWLSKAIPACAAAGNALNYDTTTNAFSCRTGLGTGTGTVTSVDLTVPSGFSVTGNPVTTSGTLAISGTLNPAAGGTGVATLANDSLLMGNGTSAMSAKAIPSCSGATNALSYNTSTDAWGCNTIAGGGSVAGSDTQVQYNNAGAFGASNRFTWDNATTTLTLGINGQQTNLQGFGSGANASQFNLLGGNSSSSGGYIYLHAGNATSGAGAGGDLTMEGGNALGTGAGGNVTLQGGLAVAGAGGSITLLARNGSGTNSNGSSVTINTGTPTGSGTPGRINLAGPTVSTGTKFTASGCSNSATVGGVQAGQFTSGTTGTCTVTITFPSAPNGWVCYATDITTGVAQPQTASTTTSCTVSGATTSTNIVSFMAMGY